MTITDPFWGLILILAIVVVALLLLDLYDRLRRKNDAFTNTYLQARAREDERAADRFLQQRAAEALRQAVQPPKTGPTGFLAQNERRDARLAKMAIKRAGKFGAGASKGWVN
jgi:hypothetical protein